MTELEQLLANDIESVAEVHKTPPLNFTTIDSNCTAEFLVKLGWIRPITDTDRATLNDMRLAGMIGPADDRL